MTAATRTLALVLAASLATSGCSALFMDRAPDHPSSSTYPVCTDSPAAPTSDFFVGAMYLFGVGGTLADRADSGEGYTQDDKLSMAAAVALGALFIASGVYGLHVRSDCIAARSTWHEPATFAPRPAPSIPVGSRGGRCYGNNTCNPGFFCHPNAHVCVPGSNGVEGGACFADGSCSAGLQCAGGLCVRPPAPECRIDANCPAGRTCNAGYCTEPPN